MCIRDSCMTGHSRGIITLEPYSSRRRGLPTMLSQNLFKSSSKLISSFFFTFRLSWQLGKVVDLGPLKIGALGLNILVWIWLWQCQHWSACVDAIAWWLRSLLLRNPLGVARQLWSLLKCAHRLRLTENASTLKQVTGTLATNHSCTLQETTCLFSCVLARIYINYYNTPITLQYTVQSIIKNRLAFFSSS